MTGYDITLTVLAVAFCCWASYTDIRHGKIENICSIGLICGGLMRYLVLLFLGEATIVGFLFAFTLGGVVAFGAYWIGILAPGDAKLYWGVTLILPASVWGRNLSPIRYPALIILVNMFVVYFAFSLIYTLVRYFRSRRSLPLPNMSLFKEVFRQLPKKMLSMLQFLTILIVIGYLAFRFRVRLGLLQLVLAIILSRTIDYVFKRLNIGEHISYIVHLVPLLVFFIAIPGLLQASWRRLLLMTAIYRLILPMIMSYGLGIDQGCLSKPVRIEHLKPGMIPGEQIIRVQTNEGVEYVKKSAVTSSLHDKNVLVSPVPEGLSEEQVEELKELSKLGYFKEFDDTLIIQYAMHFAPMILCGALITIICGGPFYASIYR